MCFILLIILTLSMCDRLSEDKFLSDGTTSLQNFDLIDKKYRLSSSSSNSPKVCEYFHFFVHTAFT